MSMEIIDTVILGAGVAGLGAAMKAREQALLGQALHVAPHGLQGHAQGLGQLLDRGRLALAQLFQQLDLAGIGVHAEGEGVVILLL